MGLKDLTGKTFGRLTVIERAGSGAGGQAMWLCQCSCNKQTVVRGQHLRNGNTKSCGCLHTDTVGLPAGEAGFNKLLRRYKAEGDKRGFSFDLTDDEARALFTGDCAYCGRQPSQLNYSGSKKAGRCFTYNGIDRVDSTIGYIPGNVVSCCGRCNSAKSDMTRDEFIELVRAIARNLQL